jgi:hypothetical protein
MRLGKAHHTTPATCPWCAAVLDAASGLDHDRAPSVGALTVCINCGGVGVFGLGLQLDRCSEAVWQAQPEPIPTMIRRARRAVVAVHSRDEG